MQQENIQRNPRLHTATSMMTFQAMLGKLQLAM
jgi:hypothetical protein